MDHNHHNHMAMTTVKQEEITAHIHAQENSGDMNHMMIMTVFNENYFSDPLKIMFLFQIKIKKKMYFHGFQENEIILFKSWQVTSVASRKK